MESTNKSSIPLFKHINRKWTKEPNTGKFEVTVVPSLVDEATLWLKGLRNYLIHNFGQEVRKHFDDYRNEQTWTIRQNTRKGNQVRENYDEDVENYILRMANKDIYTKVLIEGMYILNQKEDEEKEEKKITNTRNTTVKNTSSKSKNSVHIMESVIEVEDEKESSDDSNDSFKSTKEDEEEGSRSITEVGSKGKDQDWDGITWGGTKNTAKWDEMTIHGEVEDICPCNEKEIVKVQNTITRYGITTKEIEEWKNENWDKYDKLLDDVMRKEYDVMKMIVNDIRKRRIGEQENDKENNVISTLMGLSNNNIKAKEMVHLMGEGTIGTQTNQEFEKGANHPKNTGQSPVTPRKEQSAEGRRK